MYFLHDIMYVLFISLLLHNLFFAMYVKSGEIINCFATSHNIIMKKKRKVLFNILCFWRWVKITTDGRRRRKCLVHFLCFFACPLNSGAFVCSEKKKYAPVRIVHVCVRLLHFFPLRSRKKRNTNSHERRKGEKGAASRIFFANAWNCANV